MFSQLRNLSILLVIIAALCVILTASPVLASSEDDFRFWETQDDAGNKVVVQTDSYRVSIRQNSGAAIGSLRGGPSGNREFTAWHPDAMSGLLLESHTADRPFELTTEERSEDTITLGFGGNAGDLHVHKTYEFYRDLPWFRVRLRFENRSAVPLSGQAAPRLFNLLLPADGKPAGREIYSLDRVAGNRPMSSDLFMHRYGGWRRASPDRIGWVAVSDPAARAGLGLVFAEGAPASLNGQRTRYDETGLSLAYDRIPPGRTLKSELLVVLFQGMSSVSAMHPAFMANASIDPTTSNRLSLQLLALRWKLEDVSVVVRAYDSQGNELEAFDVVPLDVLKPGQIHKIRTKRPENSQEPDWIVAEVRSEGKLVDAFAIAVQQSPGECPVDIPPPPQPDFEAISGGDGFRPGPMATLSESVRERGFTVWRFEGQPPKDEVSKLDLHLAADESETVFLGVRALKPLDKVRATLVRDDGNSSRSARALPSASAFVWSVHEDAEGQALMKQSFGTALKNDEVMWMAMTFDADQLSAGNYRSRLVIEAGGKVREIPVTVKVEKRALPARSAFGLWLVADQPFEKGGMGSCFAALSNFRASVLSWPATDDLEAQKSADLARRCLRSGMHMLGFTDALRNISRALLADLSDQGRSAPLAAPRFAFITAPSTSAVTNVPDPVKQGFHSASMLERLPPAEDGGSATDLTGFDSILVESGPRRSGVQSLINDNRLKGEALVWLYLDLREVNWRWAAPRLRSAAWAAAWQGLSGLAVRLPPPCSEENTESAMWHLIRDAVEDAALWRAARHATKRLEDASLSDKEQQKQRALTMQTFVSTMGDGRDFSLRVAERKRPFRSVLRAVDPTTGELPALSKFRRAKADMLDVLRQTHTLIDLKTRSLYWHGIPLQKNGVLKWSIVSSGSDAAWKQAGRLQSKVAALTGHTLDVSRQFPDLPESSESVDRLVWMIGPPSEVDQVPDRVSEALESADIPTVIRAPRALVVNLPAEWASLDTLIGTFSRFAGIYSPASAVK